MRYYSFSDLGLDGKPIPKCWSEDQVLDFYWAYWSEKMQEIFPEFCDNHTNKELQEMCLEDFCIINFTQAGEYEP